MNAKLYKTEKENYVLVDPTKGTYDDGYTLGTSKESQYNKLSIKNCQAIELGYDLDVLAEKACPDVISSAHSAYKAGFQKALEILGDKKFSDDDVLNLIKRSREKTPYNFDGKSTEYKFSEDELIQSLQQTEWDIEVETVPALSNNGNVYYGDIPKLDADGCLILKLKSE